MNKEFKDSQGGCSCGRTRYRVSALPMIVHCCHCSWCQRQTGTAFALNALVEADNVQLLSGEIEEIDTISPSGKGQSITRCQTCRVALWSSYHMGGLRKHIRFVRVGTLDDPQQMPPDVHIFVSSKQPWFQLPDGATAFEEFYNYESTWTPSSLIRRAALFDAAGIAMP